jgi:type I restriction enzyme M protein
MKDTYYTISDAAELLGVTSMTLRNWEKSGKLLGKRDESNGYRMYQASLVLKLKEEMADKVESIPLPKAKILDARGLRFVVRQLSKAYRDSKGGNLLDRFEEISKIIFTKLYVEKLDDASKRTSFNVSESESPEAVFERINSLYAEAQGLLHNDRKESLKNDYQAVLTCSKILSKYELNKVPTDVKGFIYEELIKNTFDKTENQQFFTPRTVVQFMVAISINKDIRSVLDPACGSGGFLISALPYIHKDTQVIGLEIDPMMAWISQMNLVMNGASFANVLTLEGSGSLSHTKELENAVPNKSIDLVITNPPFGSDFSDVQELQQFVLGKGKKNRRRGVLFIERCLDWLKPGGHLCVVIDDGVLNGDGNDDVRRLISREAVIEAVISLPESAFMPYATVKSSILLLRKKKSKKDVQGSVFMATAKNVGRKPNGDPFYSTEKDSKGEPLLINDLPKILNLWNSFKRKGQMDSDDDAFISNISEHQESSRIDLPYYHPMRFAAQKALATAKYKTYRLGDLVSVRNVSAVPALQDPDEKWRFIGLADISSKTGQYSVQEMLGSQLKSSVKLFKPGDILFSKMRPELQKCCYILPGEDEGYTSAENIVLTSDANQLELSNKPKVLGEYLALILRSELGLGQILHQITGVGRPRIGIKTLLSIQIPLPPIADQTRIIAKHNEAWEKHLAMKMKGENLIADASMLVDTFYTETVDNLITR